jgi:hypothetical protein
VEPVGADRARAIIGKGGGPAAAARRHALAAAPAVIVDGRMVAAPGAGGALEAPAEGVSVAFAREPAFQGPAAPLS